MKSPIYEQQSLLPTLAPPYRVPAWEPLNQDTPPRLQKGDYVSPTWQPQEVGQVQSCRVRATVQWLTHTGSSHEYPAGLILRSPDDPLVLAALNQQTPRPRRYSRKGQASGWIEERQGNKKRPSPTTSYFYCCDERDETDTQKRTKVYIPTGKVIRVQQMIRDRCPVKEILAFLGKNTT